MWIFPDIESTDKYTYMRWVFTAIVAGFSDQEAPLEFERCDDEADELRVVFNNYMERSGRKWIEGKFLSRPKLL